MCHELCKVYHSVLFCFGGKVEVYGQLSINLSFGANLFVGERGTFGVHSGESVFVGS